MQNQKNKGNQITSKTKTKLNYWMFFLFAFLVLFFGKSVKLIIDSNIGDKKQSYQLQRGSEIESTLKNIFNNTIIFDKKRGNVSYFQKGFDFSPDNQEKWQHLNIIAYLYKEGDSKYKEGYEILEWTVNLDDVVQTLLSLKEGTQISKIYDTPIKDEKAEITFSKFGKRNWAVYDTYIKQGRSWTRHYVTYDQKSRIILFITFSFTYYKDTETNKTNFSYNQEVNYFTEVKYPEEISSTLEEIEIILALN